MSLVFLSFVGCDRAVSYQPSGREVWDVWQPSPDGEPPTDAGATLKRIFPTPHPAPSHRPATTNEYACKDMGAQDAPHISKQQCASGIQVVEKNLMGARTGVSIRLGEPPPKIGLTVHVAYWRCTPSCCPSKSGPNPPCSSLKYATTNMATNGYKVTSLKVQGMGPSLRLDSKGTVHISAAGPGHVYHAAPGPGGWQVTKAGTSYYSPDVRTWLGLDKGGAARVAWANLTGNVKELEQAQQTATGWKVSSTKLPGMFGAMSFAAAHDGAGGLHQAWVRGEQTIAPAQPRTFLEYRRPQKAAEVVIAKHGSAIQIQDLYVDPAGHAHLVFLRHDSGPGKAQPVYATNAKGKWMVTPLKLPSCGGNVTARHMAVFADAQGRAHVAITGERGPGAQGVLLVGNNTNNTWSFRTVDKDATGAVDIAVRYGIAFVGYFGPTSFRVARVCE